VLAEKAKKIMTAPRILMPSLNARRLERYPWFFLYGYIYIYIVEASHSRMRRGLPLLCHNQWLVYEIIIGVIIFSSVWFLLKKNN
jgi:hypothetical protein